MIRRLCVIGVMAWVCSACGSSSDSSPSGSAGSGNAGGGGNGDAGGAANGNCPDLSGGWTVTAHCDSSVVGMTLNVTEKECVLSFASPFDAFSGSVSTDGKITLDGPQSCTGSATSTSVSMNCTPDPCPVKLSR